MKKRFFGSNDPELAKKIKEGKMKELGVTKGSNKYGKYTARLYEEKK